MPWALDFVTSTKSKIPNFVVSGTFASTVGASCHGDRDRKRFGTVSTHSHAWLQCGFYAITPGKKGRTLVKTWKNIAVCRDCTIFKLKGSKLDSFHKTNLMFLWIEYSDSIVFIAFTHSLFQSSLFNWN